VRSRAFENESADHDEIEQKNRALADGYGNRRRNAGDLVQQYRKADGDAGAQPRRHCKAQELRGG
jgi:hypothetical protein